MLSLPVRGVVIAVEVHSEIRSVEQLIRWTTAKAGALPSADLWPVLAAHSSEAVQRLLIVRSTRANRATFLDYESTFTAAFPGNPAAALSALTSGGSWPGPTMIW